MSVCISEKYWFVGDESGIKTFYDFLLPFDVSEKIKQRKQIPYAEKELHDGTNDELWRTYHGFISLQREKYPIIEEEEPQWGFFLCLDSIESMNGYYGCIC